MIQVYLVTLHNIFTLVVLHTGGLSTTKVDSRLLVGGSVIESRKTGTSRPDSPRNRYVCWSLLSQWARASHGLWSGICRGAKPTSVLFCFINPRVRKIRNECCFVLIARGWGRLETNQEWRNHTQIGHEPLKCGKMCFTKKELVH